MEPLDRVQLSAVLFTPGDRPDRIAKLPSTGAHAGIVDLEDAVAPTAKEATRPLVRAACEELARRAPGFTVLVRVNAATSGLLEQDVAVAVPPTVAGVVVPKVESRADLAGVRRLLAASGLGHLGVVAGIETVRGVLGVGDLLERGSADVVYFGAEDLVADLGGERTEEGLEVL